MAWPFTVPVDYYAGTQRIGRTHLSVQTTGHKKEIIYIAKHIARITSCTVVIRVKGEVIGCALPEGSAGISALYPPGLP